ncbi:MAG TPA: hypothetical protein VF658_04585 [Pyrinomonadaceae bacterium]
MPAPIGSVARLFIEHIKYSLLLFDAKLPDTSGRALVRFTRSLPHRERTPTFIIHNSIDRARLARAIAHRLTAPR